MAYARAPQLTRWRAVVGGSERDLVEHEGTAVAVRPEDCKKVGGREYVEIDGKAHALVDEKLVALHAGGGGGERRRCVEYRYSAGAGEAVLLLTVTERMEVAEVVSPDEALRVMSCDDDDFETGTGTREYMVDVQGEREAFLLLVSVRQEIGRIVRIKRLN